jgi:hypothetical protein
VRAPYRKWDAEAQDGRYGGICKRLTSRAAARLALASAVAGGKKCPELFAEVVARRGIKLLRADARISVTGNTATVQNPGSRHIEHLLYVGGRWEIDSPE